MSHERVYAYTFGKIYPLYVQKVEGKGRTRDELDEVLRWLTGYSQPELDAQIAQGKTLREFFEGATALNPARDAVTGVVCGVRIEEIEEPLMKEIRIMDKLVDELAKGRPMSKLLRQPG